MHRCFILSVAAATMLHGFGGAPAEGTALRALTLWGNYHTSCMQPNKKRWSLPCSIRPHRDQQAAAYDGSIVSSFGTASESQVSGFPPAKGSGDGTLIFPKKISAELTIRVTRLAAASGESFSEASFRPIAEARLIVMDRSGERIATGLTGLGGIWKEQIQVRRDPRFPNRRMGAVTVIALADGYNEAIEFEVPVNEHANGEGHWTFVMRPYIPGQRNEPQFSGHYHRLTVGAMLDHYAAELGLQRQPLPDAPWSPRLRE